VRNNRRRRPYVAVRARHDTTTAIHYGNLTGMSFFLFFSVVNFGNWGKLGDIWAAWGPPGDSEPHIVPSQQSTYVNAVGDGGV